MIPLTVIGGYLGAGKTTLINQLLTGERGRRLGVLVNDFGDINIDVDLIAQHDGETLALTNGCVCCNIRDDLGAALESLRSRKIDHVLIEASGVAQPAKIADYGLTWPGYELAGTVVLVNAKMLQSQLQDKFVGELVAAQLQQADLLVVTRDSTLANGQRKNFFDHLSRPFKVFDQVTRAPEVIFNLPNTASGAAVGSAMPDPPVATNTAMSFDSQSFELPQRVDTALIAKLFEVAPTELARAKGWFTDQQDLRWQVQYADHELHCEADPTSGANRLVFIFSAARAPGQFDRVLNELLEL